MPKKELTGFVKLQLTAGKANPAPPVGPALGQHGVNIMQFCKDYNAQTQGMEGVVPALISIYSDRTFTFVLKTPPASEMLKKAAGVVKGSGKPNKDKVGKVTSAQVKEIAQTKMQDLNAVDIEGAIKIVEGTARSMGIEVSA
ncbi:MAG: 50S ribosomal protein L11 [Nitrospirae bacterium]|nr:50S ribosomal protein L11 [Nitrospirota bacterium]